MNLKFLGIERVSNKILKGLEQADKLKKIATKEDYNYKVTKLRIRLTNEYKFWMQKGPSARLDDIEKDINFLNSLRGKTTLLVEEKSRINLLVAKYSI